MTGQRKGAARSPHGRAADEPVAQLVPGRPPPPPWRYATAADVLTGPEQLFADKYMGGGRFRYDGRHGRLLVTLAKIVSWDFAKLDPLRR